jgi:hypothetical protein
VYICNSSARTSGRSSAHAVQIQHFHCPNPPGKPTFSPSAGRTAGH